MQTEFDESGLSLFSVTAGTLSVRDLPFVHDSAHANNCDSKIFEITGAGEMKISNLNISAESYTQQKQHSLQS